MLLLKSVWMAGHHGLCLSHRGRLGRLGRTDFQCRKSCTENLTCASSARGSKASEVILRIWRRKPPYLATSAPPESGAGTTVAILNLHANKPKRNKSRHLFVADKQTDRQTNKQTNKQTDKQTNKQTNKPTNKRQTHKQAQTNKQTNKQTANKQTNQQTNHQPPTSGTSWEGLMRHIRMCPTSLRSCARCA